MSDKPKKIFLSARDSSENEPKNVDAEGASSKGHNPHDISSKIRVIRYGVGLDVHKDKISAYIGAQTSEGTLVEVRYHVFSSTPKSLADMCRFIGKYAPIAHILMECAGVYHLPVVHALREFFPDHQERIVAMNPLMVHRRLGEFGNKNDHADARKMAMLSFYDAFIRPSHVGTETYHALRSFVRAYHHHNIHLVRIRNRIARNLHSINIRCHLPMSRTWVLLLLDNFIAGEWTLGEAYEDLIKRRIAEGKGTSVLEKRRPDLMPYFSIRLPEAMRWELRIEMANYLHERRAASLLLVRSERYVLKDDELYADYVALQEIPGIGAVSALTILLELGNYRHFSGIDAFVKYCGVVPTIFESTEYRSKAHANRFTNRYLRRTLTQCASIIVNSGDKRSDLGIYAYKIRFERKMPYKKALMKVANKLARTLYHVLVLRVSYDPLYELKERKRKRMMESLRRRGTLLESPYIRAIKADMKRFLADNSQFLRSRSRWLLNCALDDLLSKAEQQHRGIVINLRRYSIGGIHEFCNYKVYDRGTREKKKPYL